MAPYSRVRLDWLAAQLNVDLPEVEGLAVCVILEGRLPGGAIDQVAGVLTISRGAATASGALTPQPFGHLALERAAMERERVAALAM